MSSKGRPYREMEIEGFTVLVGRGDRDNDELSLRVAEPEDFWMHVAGPPGSHVVIRNPERLAELPKPVLRAAAELAAFHSKARDARGKVEVHFCQARDVSKPRGFAPGMVRLKRFESLRVYPRAADPGEAK